jgi:uncharacterized protein (DUF58 family)
MKTAAGAGGAIALGVAFLLGASGFGSTSLFVPGVALTLLGVGSVLWVELAARTARLVRAPGPARVVEGDPYPLRIRMHGGLVPPPGGLLRDPVLDDGVRIGPRWRKDTELEVRLPRRGHRRLAPAELIVRDPLHLHSRMLRSDGGGEVLVLPRIEPVNAAGDRGAGGSGAGALGRVDGAGIGSRPDAPGVEFEVDGLRPYREGSPASRIHWPAVARSGELIERRLTAGAGSARLVVLDARHPASEEALDRAVRAAASLCVRLADGGGCTLLLPGEGRPLQIDQRLAGWPAAHARLALVESSDGMPALGRAPRASSVFWVTGAEAQQPPRALTRFGSPNSFLVTPVPIAGLPAAFTVAGCSGQVVAASRQRATRAESLAA